MNISGCKNGAVVILSKQPLSNACCQSRSVGTNCFSHFLCFLNPSEFTQTFVFLHSKNLPPQVFSLSNHAVNMNGPRQNVSTNSLVGPSWIPQISSTPVFTSTWIVATATNWKSSQIGSPSVCIEQNLPTQYQAAWEILMQESRTQVHPPHRQARGKTRKASPIGSLETTIKWMKAQEMTTASQATKTLARITAVMKVPTMFRMQSWSCSKISILCNWKPEISCELLVRLRRPVKSCWYAESR